MGDETKNGRTSGRFFSSLIYSFIGIRIVLLLNFVFKL
jgi:hypothetical protein